MNKIILKRSTHRNFMSYGDVENEFLFPDGVVLMTAANGSGKSAIIEVINFALFGTSYRGGNKGDLRNTNNAGATMEVSLEFDLDRGDGAVESYRVFRTVDPKERSRFDVELLTDGKWVAQNKRAGYAQKDFEDKILGFNEVLFKNVIALNTQESTPFIDMTAAKRRELIESIIDMSTDFWKKESGRLLSAAATACDIAASDIERITGEIANLERICDSMRNEKKANLEQLQASLDALAGARAPAAAEADRIKGEIITLRGEIDSHSAELGRESWVDSEMASISDAAGCASRIDEAREAERVRSDAYDKALAGYRADERDRLNAEIGDLEATLGKLGAEITAIGKEVGMAEYRLQGARAEMDRIGAQGKQLVPGVPCPTCGKPSTEADIEPLRQELRRKWKEQKAVADGLEADIAVKRGEIASREASTATVGEELRNRQALLTEIQDYYCSTVLPAKAGLDEAVRNRTAIEARIASAGIDVSEFAGRLASLQEMKASFPGIRQKWQDAQARYNELTSSWHSANNEVVRIDGEVSRISGEIERARNAETGDSLAVAEGRLADAQSDLALAQERLHAQSDLRAGYGYINKTLCSDDGMKKMLLGKFVPAFNMSVQKNILHTGLPFSVEFDDTMSYEFLSAPGLSPKYSMLSQGQKRRLGFAIAMAFRDFVAMVGNFSINLLSLDEVLDISTDDAGMRDMMDIVRSMVGDIGCALVITHRVAAVADKFDYWVTIENDGLYSSVGELKKL